jgi:hypothetical protein
MATVQILYWHDIPVQVKAVAGRERRSVSLSDRFQEAVDRAAMIVGVIDSDDYTELYEWGEPQEREGTPQEVAPAVAAELEAQYETIDWRATADALRKRRADEHAANDR